MQNTYHLPLNTLIPPQNMLYLLIKSKGSTLLKTKPILRWAGGKRRLAKQIEKLLPPSINNYYEVFLGSGAIYFHLLSNGYLDNKQCYLSDANEDLINFYNQIKTNPDGIIQYLITYRNEKDFYYMLRDKMPNNQIEAAAIFYYLNRTSFNGLYRVNKNGKYNVPYGFKTYKTFIDEKRIYDFSNSLINSMFFSGDFEDILENVNEGDFIYLDPPYTVAHNKNGFIKYNKNLFSLDDQKRLKRTIDQLTDKGAYYLLSNAHHINLYEIFSPNANTIEIERFSGIGGGKDYRDKIQEYIFTNYEVPNA